MSDLFLGAPQQEHHEAPPPSRRSRRDDKAIKARRRKTRRRRSASVLVLALALVGGMAFVVWSIFGGLFSGGGGGDDSVSDFPGPGSGEVQVTVASGDTGGAIGATLEEAGVVATAKAFTDAYAANPAATGIQPGAYTLLMEMKASDAVNALLDAENRVSNRVTIPEGYTADQIYQRLYEITTIPVEDFEAAAADPAAIGLPAEAGGNVEGWLFPATYDVEPGSTAASVLSQMVARTVSILTDRGVAQDQWETVLNKASIVEREGKLDEDRAKIARAIQNRLDIEMALQIDAINAYGLGIPGTQLTTADTRDAQPPYNPYNSYKIPGLPPTPIANPGEVSIDAVLNPADGPWLFWVTVNLDTGETKFSETFAEHQTYVDELRAWQRENQ
ncbi:endolytic transglycosylase MltG [Cellulomonas triticagri]|uniref:Endolytic murein transglycosylase n=1 Tax=Cellulomonas triticagri TaxID=2483352 RepID=A0A3M2JGF9_9CELL|nr:endolytic transglycosylase MltG [Cellulomonas triticagri]RMI13107.1 endolytic transglycosylase MltG [Cellulomonas triticagri]